MLPKILSVLTGLILLLLHLDPTDAAARSLYWQDLTVQARLDRDGRLHVREAQTIVFDGEWNGGERRFSVRPGQTIDFERLQRLNSGISGYRDLVEGPLSLVDNYGWQGKDTLHWRSRLPSDPPFQNTAITYILEYSLAGIIRKDGDSYLLDHDFAFPDRASIIKHLYLNLELDPTWQSPEASPVHREITNLAVGKGLVLTLRLAREIGDPLETAESGATLALPLYKAAPLPAPSWLRLVLTGLIWLGLFALAARFLSHEQRSGRFRSLPSLSTISREWLKENVFHLPPEVVGATWDKRTSQYEVAAVIARLVQEGRITSQVQEFIIPFFNIKIARLAVLHMTLNVPRSSFAGYERKLIDGLFIAGDSTDTKIIRQYYQNKEKAFNPVAELAEPLDKQVAQLTRNTKNPLAYFWAPTVLLSAIGFFILLTNAFLHQYEFSLEILGLVSLFVLWLLGGIFALMYRNSSAKRILNLLRLFLPPVMICTGFFLLTDQSLSTLMTTGFFSFAAAALYNIFNLAKTRDNEEGVLLCQRLTAARKYFRNELKKAKPDLDDSWFPYLMAFGLGEQLDIWFNRYNSSIGLGDTGGSAGSGSSGFTGRGGQFGGGGASGAWMAAAGAMAAGSSSSSGGGGGGGSSGGGGGGGW